MSELSARDSTYAHIPLVCQLPIPRGAFLKQGGSVATQIMSLVHGIPNRKSQMRG